MNEEVYLKPNNPGTAVSHGAAELAKLAYTMMGNNEGKPIEFIFQTPSNEWVKVRLEVL